MYLSVVGNTRWSVEAYVRSCCEERAHRPSDEAILALSADVARQLSASMIEVARMWAPAAAARLATGAAVEDPAEWPLDVAEGRLRSVGFQQVEIDALYQHISEAAERPDRRAAVARAMTGAA